MTIGYAPPVVRQAHPILTRHEGREQPLVVAVKIRQGEHLQKVQVTQPDADRLAAPDEGETLAAGEADHAATSPAGLTNAPLMQARPRP